MRKENYRELTIKLIEEYIGDIQQYKIDEEYDYCFSAMSKAEALIEMLESHDCGQVGGFDKRDPQYGLHLSGIKGLKSRLAWLKKSDPQ